MTGQNLEKKLLIFLSHAREDKPAVKRLCKRLRDDGFEPWLDEERLLPGQDWNLEIEKALRASNVILLCFSTLSVAKEGYIQREYKRAMMIQEEKPEGMIFVIPVRLDDCEIPFSIRDLQWVDYPSGYYRLLLSLQSKSGGTAMPAKTPRPKKSAPRKPAASKESGGPTFNVQGGIHIGRDMISGDQINYINETNLNITSPTQFIEELKKLKDEIERLKTQPNVDPAATRRMEVAQADIQDAIDEAQKEAPVAERVNKTLDGAKETMEKLGGSIGAAINLGSTLGNLALLALRLFGGG